MRTIKLSAIIGKSIEGTTAILFRPFSSKKWLRLLLIAFLAGALGGGGGNGGGGGGSNQPTQQKKEISQTAAQNRQQPAAPATEEAPASKPPIAVIVILISLAVILIFGIIILTTWLGSRFRFIWFNAVVNNTTAMREPYSRHKDEAKSLFKFSIILFFGFMIYAAIIGAGIWYSLLSHGAFKPGFIWSVSAGLQIFLLPAILLVVVVIGLAILSYIIDHFIVPIMALEGLRITKAFKKLGPIFRSYRKDIFLFTLVFLLLSIAGGAIAMALIILLFIALILAALITFGIPFLIIWLLLKAKLVFVIYAIAAGIPFAVLGLILLLAVSLPFAVFFRLFSINYLISLDCGYTQDSLSAYASRKAERISGKAPIVLGIVSLFLIIFVFFAGLFAAIAIPNFIKARDAARQKQALSKPR